MQPCLPQGTHSTFRVWSCLWMPSRCLTPMPVAETQGLFFLGWAGAQAHYRCLGLLSAPADAESSLCLHCIFHLGPGGGCLALALCWVDISPSSWPASWPLRLCPYTRQSRAAQGSKPILPQPIQSLPSWAAGLCSLNSVYYNFAEMT